MHLAFTLSLNFTKMTLKVLLCLVFINTHVHRLKENENKGATRCGQLES